MILNPMPSRLFSGSWVDEEVAREYSDEALIDRWLNVLKTLALVQAELGLIPSRSAHEISEHCRIENFSVSGLAERYNRTGHSLAGLIEIFQQVAPKSASDYFCFGVTVQDVTDTANGLAFKKLDELIAKRLRGVLSALRDLVARHKTTPMLGRTHGQSGSLITFGYKCAVYLDALNRHSAALRSSFSSAASIQLGGAVGNLNAFGSRSFELRQKLAQRLGLHDPNISWTNERSALRRVLNDISLVAELGSQLSNELYNLQRSEIGEVSEPRPARGVGSITMPFKRNPEFCEQIGTLGHLICELCRSSAVVHEHERDGKAWKLEWAIVPQVLTHFGKQLELLKYVLSGLEVHSEQMRENIESTRGLCFSEPLLFTLGSQLGLVEARKIVAEVLSQVTSDSHLSLLDAVKSIRSDNFDQEHLQPVFNLENNIRSCVKMCDQILTVTN